MLTPEFLHLGKPEEIVAVLEALIDQARAGLPVKAAFRTYMADGTVEHYVIAPTVEEENEMRAALEAEFSNPQ